MQLLRQCLVLRRKWRRALEVSKDWSRIFSWKVGRIQTLVTDAGWSFPVVGTLNPTCVLIGGKRWE